MTARFLPIKENLFILIFNVGDDEYDPNQAQKFVEDSSLIEDWWNYFPGVFIVQAKVTVDELYAEISSHLDRMGVLVIRLQKENFSGLLPGMAWLWLLDLDDNSRNKFARSLIEDAKK